MMEHAKPKVIIDMAEYEELISIKSEESKSNLVRKYVTARNCLEYISQIDEKKVLTAIEMKSIARGTFDYLWGNAESPPQEILAVYE